MRWKLLKVELTEQQCAILIQLMNQVSGVENARVLIPIHDAIREAVSASSVSSSE
jgi:hypothetical protein